MGGVRPKAMNVIVPPACETTRATKPCLPRVNASSVVNNELKASQLGDSVQFCKDQLMKTLSPSYRGARDKVSVGS